MEHGSVEEVAHLADDFVHQLAGSRLAVVEMAGVAGAVGQDELELRVEGQDVVHVSGGVDVAIDLDVVTAGMRLDVFQLRLGQVLLGDDLGMGSALHPEPEALRDVQLKGVHLQVRHLRDDRLDPFRGEVLAADVHHERALLQLRPVGDRAGGEAAAERLEQRSCTPERSGGCGGGDREPLVGRDGIRLWIFAATANGATLQHDVVGPDAGAGQHGWGTHQVTVSHQVFGKEFGFLLETLCSVGQDDAGGPGQAVPEASVVPSLDSWQRQRGSGATVGIAWWRGASG